MKNQTSYKDYTIGTGSVLEKSQQEQRRYIVKVIGREFIVLPNVFSPKYFNDTEIFAKHLPITPGEEMLEIGPGTGAISITAAYRGAKKVLAIDINPDAVKNTHENIQKHKLEDRIEVRLGDLYEALKPGEKFDSIFWNTPFAYIDEGEVSDLEKAVYDPGYKSTKRFILEAKEHLKKDGRVLIGFSTTLGKFKKIEEFCQEAGFDLRLIFEAESEEVHPVKFEIFEARAKEQKDIYILGINSAYHESSAAILKNGVMIAAVEEERYNRKKHAKTAAVDNPDLLPLESIDFCLAEAGISFHDLDYIGFSFNPKRRLKNIRISKYYAKASWGTPDGEKLFHDKLLTIPKKLETIYNCPVNDKFVWVDHHLAHAASSFFVSPFDKSLVTVLDGIGENATAWIGYGKNNKLFKLKEIDYPNSLGFLWEKFSEYLGFTEYDSGKVMGLASYGDWKVYNDKFNRIVGFDDLGIFKINNEIMRFRTADFSAIEKLFGVKKRPEGDEVAMEYKHIAAALQKVSQKIILRTVKYAYDIFPCKNLCLSGGVVLNCVANEESFAKLPIDDLYIPPATHDGGTSVGAAYYIWHQKLNKPRGFVMENPYTGPEYNPEEIKQALEDGRLDYQKVKNISKRAAKFIADGKIVAWFQGKEEFGPRALGGRSILADPRRNDMRTQINVKVKKREPFRPFAPSVLEEKASAWFYLRKVLLPDRFMLLAGIPIFPEKIPAVTHVDETCRIQTVNRKLHPTYHALLKEFDRITGIPMVLNTSFNIQEPIVLTPTDAVKTFKKSKIDYLAIGDYLAKNSNYGKSREDQI